jgi:hypothetical protein
MEYFTKRRQWMKAKTIKKILRGKFETWKKTITDEKLRNRIEKGTIITGGCITSLLLNEKVKDFDLYFSSEDLAYEIAKYYVKQYTKENKGVKQGNNWKDITVMNIEGRIKIMVKSSGVASSDDREDYRFFEELDPGSPEQEEFLDGVTATLKADHKAKRGEYKPIFITTNSVTLSSSIQLIIRFYGNPDQIHKNYDFVHCTNYWTSWNDALVLQPKALESILTKELIYTGSLYPVCSIIRTRKFIGRGWTINAGQFLKMCMQVNELDLQEYDVLEDQLIGVDIAYFRLLLDALKDAPQQVDSTYIAELVDRIF